MTVFHRKTAWCNSTKVVEFQHFILGKRGIFSFIQYISRWFVHAIMEIIIGSVLFKAFMKGTQNASCKDKLKINKPAIPSVLENSSLKNQLHNLPGTPLERLSLKTTVILD